MLYLLVFHIGEIITGNGEKAKEKKREAYSASRVTLPPMFRHLETKPGGDYVTDYIL